MDTSLSSVIRVLIVDDHPLVIEGIARFLSGYQNVSIVGTASDEESLRNTIHTQHPDVVLMDVKLGKETSGFDLIEVLYEKCPLSKVIMLTAYDDEDLVLHASEVGAYGYLLKSASPEVLYGAICAVHAGDRWVSPEVAGKLMGWVGTVAHENIMFKYNLSHTHLAILSFLAKGKTITDIANELSYSERSVKRKLQEIIDRLEVNNKVQAVAKAFQLGLIR